MKRICFTLFLIILLISSPASALTAATKAAVGASGAAAPSGQWYYAGDLTDTSYTVTGRQVKSNEFDPGIVTLPTGNVTKFGVMIDTAYKGTATAIKVGLFKTSDKSVVCSGTLSLAGIASGMAWVDVTASSTPVTAGTYYIGPITDATTNTSFTKSNGSTTGYWETDSYASFPPSTLGTMNSNPNFVLPTRVWVQ